MLVKTYGCAVYGIEAIPITIETNLGKGINFFLVGLPDSAIKESHQRIKAAFTNSDYKFPQREITHQHGARQIFAKKVSAYDLTIAVGILSASEQIINDEIDKYIIMGELSLDGGLQPIRGALSIAIKARDMGYKGFILPKQNANEAAIVEGIDIIGCENIQEVVDHFNGSKCIAPSKFVHTENEK
jgi:magnesium chelatase family protein